VYLLDNGHMFRGGSDPGTSGISGAGQGGRFQEFDFDGNLVWDFKFNSAGRLPHHDVAVLPNGNFLAIVWEAKTADAARRAGRKDGFIPQNGIWPDMLIEFEPLSSNGARIVWEWHIWDHLIQNIDSGAENFGDIAQHPERINVNGDTIGRVPSAFPARDVFHTNSVNYNPDLDQILLSVPTFNEVWVIDHSTTTQQAAGSAGGRYGKGGDLLYRWGNPQVYGRGTSADRLLGFQHDAHWIPQGVPGAGNMMVFSTQTPGANGDYTKVYEFAPPVGMNGGYAVSASGPFEPAAPVWTYSKPDTFQASLLSGADRLENANTFISSGPQGRLFEVTSAGDIVWEYWSPYGGNSSSGFTLFRALKVRPDHPALKGRDLRPLSPQPPVSTAALITGGTIGACPAPIAVNPPSPALTGILPASGAPGTSVNVVLTGANMVSPIVAVNGEGVAVTNVQVRNSESVTATFTVAPGAASGAREVAITTAGGVSSSVAFTVMLPQPTLSSIVPAVGVRDPRGAPLEVTLTGTNFVSALALDAGAGITVIGINVLSSTKATAMLRVETSATLGARQVSVTTSGGTSGPAAFTVTDAFPDLSIRSSHNGNFAAGFDETYTIEVTNRGAVPTAGAITVSDTLPPAWTFVSSTADDWSCSVSRQGVLCTNFTVLAANTSSSYSITVAVNGSAASNVNHIVSVSAEGDLNAANNTASDPTTVVAPTPHFVFKPSPPVAGQGATVAVNMDTPFPHDVSGSVTLTFASTASIPTDDPAAQFAVGGRSVTFTIPANGTEARFDAAIKPGPLGFQPGTVAGNLNFDATVQTGSLQTGFSAAMTIPQQAPAIQKIQTTTGNGFTAEITLFSPAREVTELVLQFNTTVPVRLSCGSAAGCVASGSTLTFDVRSMFNTWFAGDTTFGSLSTMRLPLSIPGTVHGTVGVTLRNNRGTSNSMSFALP